MKVVTPMIDDGVAMFLLARDGRAVVGAGGPMARVQLPYSTLPVDMGWVVVCAPISSDGKTPKMCATKRGCDLVRATYFQNRKRVERSKHFWWADSGQRFSPQYYVEYLRACGVPTLADIETTLRTLEGDDLCDRAEVSAKKRAARKGIAYEMPEGWFKEMYRAQRGLCALARLPMMLENGKLCYKIPVPDRIDASVGYVPGNVRLLRHGVNMMRRDMSDEMFFEMCASVAWHRGA